MSVTVLTDAQFADLLTDRTAAIEREKRALELAESLRAQNMALLSGLVFYTKEEVAGMFKCSSKQIERYEKAGGITPTRIGGKVLYSAMNLKAFVDRFAPESTIEYTAAASSYPRRKRT